MLPSYLWLNINFQLFYMAKRKQIEQIFRSQEDVPQLQQRQLTCERHNFLTCLKGIILPIKRKI